ncbi:hypothetical protein AB0E55_22890 [Amycolatopsis keratiniphila]|uniref:hypothetical protein n=1 Tax=Amycolatopsis keratiniphila TaxID=129921 RepID=UPI0033D59E76
MVHIAVRVNSGNRRTDDDVGLGGGLAAARGRGSSVMTFNVAAHGDNVSACPAAACSSPRLRGISARLRLPRAEERPP